MTGAVLGQAMSTIGVVRQTPALQTPDGHTRPQAPQLLASLVVAKFTSQPSVALPLQLPKPVVQVKPQALEAQVGIAFARAGQAMPQAPQLVTLRVTSVSQPVAGLPSQLPKPVLQAPSTHDEDEHVAPAWAKLQTIPQAPQLSASLVMLVSQPLVTLPSQLARLASQA